MRYLVVILLLTGCAAKPVAVAPPVATVPLWQQPAVLKAMVEPGDDPRAVCPVDVAVYLRMNNLAAWRGMRDSDPLVALVWDSLTALKPPQLWSRAAGNLGMDDGQLADAVFGRCTVLIVKRLPGGREIPMVFARMDKKVIDRLPAACAMKPWEEGANLGPYHLYRAPDPEGDIAYALGKRWIAVASARHVDHLRTLLCAVPSGETALRDDDAFNRHIADLPAERDALFLARSTSGHVRHALAVVRDGRDATFTYSGINPNVAEFDQRFMIGGGMDFSPMPSSVLAGASINVIEEPRHIPGAVKLLLFPRSFKRHVMGRLRPSVAAFFGPVDTHHGKGLPAVGVAIAMTDKRVAEDLDSLVVAAHTMANLGKFDLLRLLFGMKKVEHDGGWYRVADFGKVIQQHVEGTPLAEVLRHPASAGLTHLTFGPIGEWYVIASQEAMFRDCLDAAQDESARLTATDDYRLMSFDPQREGLLISGMSRVSAMAPMMNEAADFWRLSGLREKQGPYDAPLQWLATAMQHRRVLSFQVWRAGEQGLRGELHVIGE